MAGQRSSSCSFEDILIAVLWGGPLMYIEGIFWGSGPPYDDLCFVLFRVTHYAIHQSYQEIKYTWGSRSYDYQFSVMYTMHLHTLLTECCTHVYSYIVDDTVDI